MKTVRFYSSLSHVPLLFCVLLEYMSIKMPKQTDSPNPQEIHVFTWWNFFPDDATQCPTKQKNLVTKHPWIIYLPLKDSGLRSSMRLHGGFYGHMGVAVPAYPQQDKVLGCLRLSKAFNARKTLRFGEGSGTGVGQTAGLKWEILGDFGWGVVGLGGCGFFNFLGAILIFGSCLLKKLNFWSIQKVVFQLRESSNKCDLQKRSG